MLGVFDIGGTGYRTATFDIKEQIANIKYNETPKYYNRGIPKLIESLYQSGAGKKFTEICGCVPGTVDKSGRIVNIPNLPDWKNKPLGPDLESEFGCPVILDNDAALEGLGESIYGAGRGFRRIVYFTAGTGIGGSVIEIQDARFKMQDIEPGWTYKIGDKFLEDVAGGLAMEITYGKKPQDITDVEIWKREAEFLAYGINKAFDDWKPEVIVLGGSLFRSIDMNYLNSLVKGKTKTSKLGQEAGLWGALARSRFGASPKPHSGTLAPKKITA